ncbi:flagellar filament capping protein FliD [Desulforamulus aeronauticus]|uniref:Flagellar hook-associated protein 2 n=1 Tax=Desulforamulus aeronauticus DSM 10349 TaxID=1121421 RepID=A0A1M6RDG8_9FIRM|nr:flagellar filament capping protein FliD [Desulforamulus aeronauticus]SHK30501.1 flagellar hook-associated protein 2 [Desulforamulus aeronauticus DSM 10349]
MSINRIGGLVSGMDIDQIVRDLMKVERMKGDKLGQQKQILEWQQEEYRSMNSLLRSFRDNFAFKMRLSSTFLTKLSSSSNKEQVGVTANPDAVPGTRTIKVDRLAQGASVTGAKIGSSDRKDTLKNQLDGLRGVSLEDKETLKINDTVFKFDTKSHNIQDIVQRINNQKFVGVSTYITQQAVDTDEENGIAGQAQIQTLEFTDSSLVNGLVIKIGDKSVGLYSSKNYTDDTVAKAVLGVDFVYKIEDLGQAPFSDKSSELVSHIKEDLVSTGAELSINAANPRELTITSLEVGGQKAVSASISGGKEWTVRASYDQTLDRFFLSTNKSGADQFIQIEDGNLAKALNLTSGSTVDTRDADIAGKLPADVTYKTGQNAKVEIDGLVIEDYTSNQFTLNGVTYNLFNTTDQAVTVTVSQDTEGVLGTIKSFVEEYNKLLETIEAKLNEKRYKDYTWPLSDEQREKLTDDQVNQWKERARSGMLRNDETLRQIRNQMRVAAAELSKIGITTTAEYTTGKLEITEQGEKKLRQALENDLTGVMDLFTNTSNGVAQKLSDNVSSSILKIMEQAGASGNKTDDDSFLGKRIDDLNDRLDDWEKRLEQVEDRYWRKFSAMESALNRLNQQSAWLTQQFGGGS